MSTTAGRATGVHGQSAVTAVRDVIEKDRRSSVHFISEHGCSHAKSNKTLGMNMVAGRWVPRLVTTYDMERCVRALQNFPNLHEGEGEDFLDCIITINI